MTLIRAGTNFKPGSTLCWLLVAPKDLAKKEETYGVAMVYLINYEDEKEEEGFKSPYIGETARALKTRAVEHGRPSSTSSEVAQHLHLSVRPHLPE